MNNYDSGVYGSLMDEDMVGNDLEMDGIEEVNSVEDSATEDCEMEAEPHDYVTGSTVVPSSRWSSYDNIGKDERQQWAWNSFIDNSVAHVSCFPCEFPSHPDSFPLT